jgi:FkbM family methyltransferase
MIVANGSHEPNEMAFMSRAVQAGDTFIDVGANVGLYSVVAGQIGAHVLAFEPDAGTRSVLEANLAANCLDGRSCVLPIALANWDGTGVFTSGLDVANHLGNDIGAHGSVTVSVAQLDSLLAASDILLASRPSLVFVKVDAEGHDLEVLRGAGTLLTSYTPVIMVEVWQGGRQIREYLEGFGYQVFQYHETNRSLLDYPAAFSGQANFIALHSSHLSMVRARLADSKDIAIAPPAIVGWSDR